MVSYNVYSQNNSSKVGFIEYNSSKVSSQTISKELGYSVGEKPGIEISYKIILSTLMAKALEKYSPDFKIWQAQDFIPPIRATEIVPPNQFPSCLFGDFNGDGIIDAVLMGQDKTNELVIAVLSKHNAYEITEIERFPFIDPKEIWTITEPDKKEYGLSHSLTLLTRGKVVKTFPNPSSLEITLMTDAFVIEYFEKASRLYIYKDGRFISYPLSD